MTKILSALAIVLLTFAAQAKDIRLTTGNTVNFRGPVTMESVTEVQLKLIKAVKDRGSAKYPIYLVMDSPGGSIYAGESFIELAKTFKNVHTITLFAASMGSAIVEALPGKRYITSSGIMMFHRAAGTFKGQFEDGEVESSLRFWKRFVRRMEVRNADRLGIALEVYKARVVNEWWESGSDAVYFNMADEVVNVTCSQKLIDKEETGNVRGFFGLDKAVFSACPLLQNPLP